MKRLLVEPEHPALSVARQCALLGMARSSWYYTPQSERAENLELMRLLDEQYTRTPFYGIRRMTAWLRQEGYAVNHKRVGRLLRCARQGHSEHGASGKLSHSPGLMLRTCRCAR